MAPALLAVVLTTAAAIAFWHWQYVYALVPEAVSGDGYYIRRMAFTNKPQSAPYAWRPLFPLLARYLGFRPVTYVGCFASVLGMYHYSGGGWAGAAMAIGFLGNIHTVRFSMRASDYCDGLGHGLFVLSLLALRADSAWAYPLVVLSALCRENLGVTLSALAVFVNPLISIAGLGACAAAYFSRREDKVNRHPLVEANAYDTLVRWVRVKREGALHFAHTVQPLRGLPFAVPFGWAAVSGYDHRALLGIALVWFFALPASGQSRQLSYAYALLAPFGAACGVTWAFVLCLLSWFWPADIAVFDEGGGISWGSIK